MTDRPAAGPDLRLPALGAVAWLTVLACLRPGWWILGVVAAAAALGTSRLRARGRLLPPLAWSLVAAAVALVAWLHVANARSSGLEGLVADRASISGLAVVDSDPVHHDGRFDDYVLVKVTLLEAIGRGREHRVRAPVLVIGEPAWSRVGPGEKVRLSGRFASSDSEDLVGMLHTRGPPQVVARSGPVLRGAATVRAHIRAAARDGSPAGALVPALVDGDDAALRPALKDDFRTSGLTHLLAVSGTNLTLLAGFLLVLARTAGVRARGLVFVGLVGVVCFVLLARAEPSVLRAAVMGSIGLVGMGVDGTRRGLRYLGGAVVGLLLADPWLAVSPGFALSVSATAGILFLAPGWRDALAAWLPRWLAEAIAVPLAAQLACTPLVAAISGQVSLVAVVANVLAAPAVGPATVLGLAGGLAGLVHGGLGVLVARPAVWSAHWIVLCAQACAGLPVAAISWATTGTALLALTLACAGLALVLADVLRRRLLTSGLAGLAVVVLLVPLPRPGWPPPGWVLVACDVGQGDALVLNAGHGAVVVVDTGPQPEYVDRCLRDLGVHRVPLVLLTHFHADHVDGLPGVLDGREVGEVQVSPVADPLSGSAQVRAQAAAAGVPVHVAEVGGTGALGALRWQVLAPVHASYAESESPPNDGSLVLLVQARGLRLLLMGDEERASQADLARAVPGLRADVLKVAHHGSSKQDEELVRGLGARLAVISVGRGNDYGHPAAATLRLLAGAGMRVARTDRQGDVAVVLGVDGGLGVATRLPRRRPAPGSVGWS